MLPGRIRQGTDCPEMLSALGNRPVGGARGGKRGAIAPPTLCKLVGSLGGCAAGQGAFCSLAHLPRGGGAQDPLHLSRQHPLFTSPQPPESLPSCPHQGLVHSPRDRTVQLG